MSAFVDTSVLIDYLRGHDGTATVLEEQRATGPLHASEITRLEVLAGMRPGEEDVTRTLVSTLVWHAVDAEVAERAGALGRQWLPSHHTIDSADLAIAASAQVRGHERAPFPDVSRIAGAVLTTAIQASMPFGGVPPFTVPARSDQLRFAPPRSSISQA